MAVDTDAKQSSLEGDVNGAASCQGIESGRVSLPWTHMQNKAYSREMLMALPGDREWESQLAKHTYGKKSSLEGDVNGAARGPRVGESVGRGQV